MNILHTVVERESSMHRSVECAPVPAARGHAGSARGLLVTGLVTLWLLAGCSSLQPLPVETRHAAHGSWVVLQGMRSAEVSPGVWVELPDGPYRARFADASGIYYQSSLHVVYRTVHGAITLVEGGLYVRFDQPGVAVVWGEPHWGAATMPHLQTFAVQRFTPRLNGSTARLP